MSTGTIYEIIGYTGSALVVISMLMTSIIRLRVINLTGSLIFTVYALLIRSYPTAGMNVFLVGINVWHLIRLQKTSRHYDVIRTDPEDSTFAYLLNTSMADIRLWLPDFTIPDRKPEIACLVCHDRNPAGLFLASDSGDGTMEVLLDYALPVYRDTSVGQCIYGYLAKEGYRTAVFRMNAPKHVGYMEKVGYRKNDRGEYVLPLRPQAG